MLQKNGFSLQIYWEGKFLKKHKVKNINVQPSSS